MELMRMLRKGDTGNDVAAAQRLLDIAADGVFGPITDGAVRDYQNAHGLTVDGIIGPRTWGSLCESRGVPSDSLDAVARLVKFAGRGGYVLGAGGTDPLATSPFTWRGAQNGSDCVGAVLWALRCARHRDDFPEYEGDINTDSMLMDAGLAGLGGKGEGKFFRPLAGPMYPGTIVVYRSVWARDIWPGKEADHECKPGDMIRMGHVGLVAGWDGLRDPGAPEKTPWDLQNKSLITVECRASWPAVRFGRNVSFIDGKTVRDHVNPDWGVHFLTYVGPVTRA